MPLLIHLYQLGKTILSQREKRVVLLDIVCFYDHVIYRWTATGGQVSTQCGSVDNGSALVFSNAGTRELTTPNMDTTVAAEVQFYLMIGMTS